MKTMIKKNNLRTLFFTALLAITFSCSSDDSTPSQSPLAGYLTATGFDQLTTDYIDAGDYEFGYSFIPLADGKMTAIVAKIPDAHPGMRVTVWDKVAGTVLRTETIDITTADVEVTKSITALDLVKDKEYFITFNSNDWYDHRRTDGANATYPFTVGDIKITSYSYNGGTSQSIPDTPVLYYYAGDLSFKFKKS